MTLLADLNVAAQLGLQAITFKPKRSFGEFTAQVTLEESHRDELNITEHPVESGAAIADHAYRRPAELTIRCAWSNSPSDSGYTGIVKSAAQGTVSGVLAAGQAAVQAAGIQSGTTGNSESQVRAVYAALLAALQARVLIDIYTGKRNYTNMLLKSVSTSTTEQTENALMVTAVFQQVIIANTKVIVAVPQSQQKFPSSTNPISDYGSKALQSTTQLPGYFSFIPQ